MYQLTYFVTVAAKTINFGRTVVDNCPIFENKEEVELPEFKPHHLYGEEGVVFTAEIGTSQSEQGYKALTGMSAFLTLSCNG